MADLLLHSLKELDEIIFAVIENLRPKSIMEIGSETGAFSDRLLAFCAQTNAQLLTIEPAPAEHLVEFARSSDVLHLVVGMSVDYLAGCGCTSEIVLIDGDHNYWTVSHEIALIDASWKAHRMSGAMLLHDVGFPSGRRDAYYDPNQIPEEGRHPFSFELGVKLGSHELVPGGFRGEGAFAWALQEGGERNGVLTAVEDFVRAHPEYVYRSVDAVFGLGALTIRDTEADRVVAEAFAKYDNALVRRLERNRLELYLKVIELQDALTATAAKASKEPA